MATVTSVYHRKPYGAIDPTLNSQSGRTVLITGSTSGIGFATAQAFLKASASTIVILGRREAPLSAAVKQLEEAGADASATKIIGRICDMAKPDDIQSLWEGLKRDGVNVDVLILNAALGSHVGVLLKGVEPTWKIFETNVLGNLIMTEKFLAQGPAAGKILLNVSTVAAHSNPMPTAGAYGASKAAISSLMQHLADERPKEEVRILSLHPGAVLTEQAMVEGYTEDTLPWDSVDLPAYFLVWAASSHADFLHGRFVWANWDVDELLAMRGRIEADNGFLKIGLQGIPSVDLGKTFEVIRGWEKKEDA